ncbi:MAG TPA: MarC family protein [Burkholderiales bacterium]|nr:MarC family protein [Burkholderiales bacterium]
MAEPSDAVSLGAVFTLFFVMLGPLKILGPFAKQTHEMEAGAMRKLAFQSFALAIVALLVGGFFGRSLADNWHISTPALLLAAGIIFALVGLNLVFEQYERPQESPAPLPAAPIAAVMRITFPTIVTPYGIAALILLLVHSPDAARTQGLLGILALVMVLNLLAMLFARWIMRGVGILTLQVLGAVLGVLQVALAIDIILRALRSIGAVHG